MIKSTIAFLSDIFAKREIIYALAKRDFQQQYLGSYLGFIWTFLQPLIFISVIYAVFTLGLRQATSSSEIPFGLYLICGMVCWIFFSKNLSETTNVVRAHAFLMKRVDFRLSVLPIVKILSSLFPHMILTLVCLIAAWYQGFPPSVYSLQLLYYIFAASMLLLGLGWFTSSTSIFVKDISKVVAVLTQFGFWLTPIFWNISLVPDKYHWLVKLNPVYYLVSGYRDSLVLKIAFWEKPGDTLYFWGFTVVVLIIGMHTFRTLRPQFVEVI